MRKPIDFDTFLTWAQQHFTDIKVSEEKIRLNSIYCNHLGGDEKHHLWCRPYTGHFHCYKSGKRGTLYDLVMDVEKCSYSQAVDTLGGKQTLRYLEAKLEEFLASEAANEKVEEKPVLTLPENSISVTKLLPPYQAKVANYLKGRKIPLEGLYYCINGEFYGRIIIPYYNSDGELVYFNARDIIHPKPYLRYRGPDSGLGFKKSEVVWMSFFPRKGAKIYLTEGEFDAMTLNLCGLHGCATGGKDVTSRQIAMIRDYEVCIAFDRDPSGKDAFRKLGWELYMNGVKKVTFVRPPEPYKDWNEMLAGNEKEGKPALSEKVIRAYISQNEKPFNEFTSSLLNY
jgi:DNA primase